MINQQDCLIYGLLAVLCVSSVRFTYGSENNMEEVASICVLSGTNSISFYTSYDDVHCILLS